MRRPDERSPISPWRRRLVAGAAAALQLQGMAPRVPACIALPYGIVERVDEVIG